MLMAAGAQTQNASRAEQLAQVKHSIEMEGLEMTPGAKRDAEEYAHGRIGIDELIRRGRARYGLD